MLSYDGLISAAKDRGMPGTKMRGVLREYLQVLILKNLYRLPVGRKFCFTGGTYLRLVHQAKRFSEDLDFNASGLSKKEFEATIKKTGEAMRREGADPRIAFSHWKNLLVAEMVFPDVERMYRVESKHAKKEGIRIKLEVNRPRWKIEPETLMVRGFGEMYPVICTQRGALFADKIDALVKKNRARHLFDILYMLGLHYPVDEKVLEKLGIKGPPLDVIFGAMGRFSGHELKSLAESIRPFLFDEREAELIVNAKTIIPQLVEQYRRVA